MFKSISNNFGAPQIEFDDFQSDNITILNAHFDIDPTLPGYDDIAEFEIKVPALKMNKSAVTAVFLRSDEPTHGYGTILKSRIKDSDTITIEKLGGFEEYGIIHIDILSAYVKLGYRGPMEVQDLVKFTVQDNEIPMTLEYNSATVKGRWMHLFFVFRTARKSLPQDQEHTYQFTGLPEDTDCIVPIIMSTATVQDKGTSIALGHLKGNTFTFKRIPQYVFTSNDGHFVNLFIVRKGTKDSTLSTL